MTEGRYWILEDGKVQCLFFFPLSDFFFFGFFFFSSTTEFSFSLCCCVGCSTELRFRLGFEEMLRVAVSGFLQVEAKEEIVMRFC